MSLRRLLYHGALYGLTSALARFLNWLLTPLYVHRLPVEEFGRLSELYSWMVFGLIATGLGMETAYFRFAQREALGASFWRILRILGIGGLGLNGLLALLVPVVAKPLGYAGREMLLWLTIAIWTVDAWGSFTLAHQRAVGAPLRFAAIQIGHVIFFLLLNIWGVGIQGYGLDFILWANLAASLLRLGWGIWWGPDPQPSASAPSEKILLRYGFTLTLMGLLGATNDVLDRVLLARYDLVQTALYGAAYKAAMALALFVQAYRQAGEPFFLGEKRNDTSFFQRSWLLYHTIALGGLLLLTIWAQPLLTTRWGGLLPRSIFPPAYHPALGILPILLWANLLTGTLIQASVWYKLKERPTAGVFITASGSLITWLGNLYGIPRYGYWASAWTTLFAYGSMVGLSLGLGYPAKVLKSLLLPLLLPVTVGALYGVMYADPAFARLSGTSWRIIDSLLSMALLGLNAYGWLRMKRESGFVSLLHGGT